MKLLPVRLTQACRRVLRVAGAALSGYQGGFRIPIGSSDEMATLAERLQFTHSEGSCVKTAVALSTWFGSNPIDQLAV